MNFQINQRYCPTCGRRVLGIRERPNHILHLLLSVVTAGLWLIVWLFLGLSYAKEPWHCPYCGSSTIEVGAAPKEGPGSGAPDSQGISR